MDNITEYINSSIIKMFAEHSKLIASIKNLNDREKLLIDLKTVLKWTEENSMKGPTSWLQIGPKVCEFFSFLIFNT